MYNIHLTQIILEYSKQKKEILFNVFYEASTHLKPKLAKDFKEKLQVNMLNKISDFNPAIG